MVASVSVGALLSGLGVYGPLVEFAGAGGSIPLPGFGHTLVTGMTEEAGKVGLFGILSGGFRTASSGLVAAILFGYIMALVFNPKG